MTLRRLLRILLAFVAALALSLAWPVPVGAATTMHWGAVPAPGGFARALTPRDWDFPADFGAHPAYQTEWWYYTGNLETAEGRPFGYQFTIFRQALRPPSATASAPAADPASLGEPSSWRTPQIYSAHFTVSDIAAGDFLQEERFGRGALGLAGAEADPYAVWLNDWRIAAAGPGRVRLQASTDAMAIDLTLRQSRPPVLQGRDGLSRKGSEPGNASHYYSLVQQPTEGSLTVAGRTHAVQGVSWKDHEFSTSALSPGTVGWDWFSAQFEDGSALMLYDLRREDGGREPFSGGRWIHGAEELELGPQEYGLEITDTWRSPHSGARYPAAWTLSIPRLDLRLEVTPQMADQELATTSATYWEGALRYAGRRGEQTLRGVGYGELTGYADRLDSLRGG
ncbi:lipocalin-like domain-containing protein [Synechococcus sp. CCY 9618]|uniref:lipocalin-like domain-containing protein n=1 Tax=Synechococcus sp. CCY 9618 TaxID=2815602 RepID=UPI001C23ABCD|nr:lipocalin-like domain-containing protein [Synechococcus sp. CCY 9618]